MRLSRFDFGVVKRLLRKLSKRPGLVILIILLTVITAGLIKPDFYLMGWDNFSSYFNLKNQFINTLFAAWREHRGLGVPSDAEINDIFRQVFYIIMSLVFKKELLDQLYMAFMLWGGTLGMYGLGRHISRHQLKAHVASQELFGFLAAVFYLFNLSTLAVFYFPMIMYVTRFFMLPTTLLVILNLVEHPHISLKSYLWYLLLLFIGFGAYMVPTIFIVMAIALGLLMLFLKKKKRVIGTVFFVVALGLFWMLPFANYTKEKSAIVPMAPTFIEINESMLNKPKSYYSFERQAKMRPSFFDSAFYNNATGKTVPFHPIAAYDENGTTRMILWIFPALYLAGAAYILLFRRNRVLMFFAGAAILFLLLSMKEYSPVGLIYGFVSEHVPFANTIFRFGDTKFHAFIAFGGSIVAANLIVGMGQLVEQLKHRILTAVGLLLVAGLVGIHAFTYSAYFNGNMIGFFMYNKIPAAYFDIVKTINNDPEPARVIQLPYDTHTYWKPYSWGYFGSAFLHFMLNKPLFDRTFEPGSLEASQIHQQFMDLSNMAASAPDDKSLEARALDMYHLLTSLSIKYVIDDQTITTNIDARNIVYWGTIKPADSHRVLNYLYQNGYLTLVKQYGIAAQDFADDYTQLYPYNKKTNYDYPKRNLTLYQVAGTQPRMAFASEAEKVNTANSTLLPQSVLRSLSAPVIQAKQYDGEAVVFPFALPDPSVSLADDTFSLSAPVTLPAGDYLLSSRNDTAYGASQQVNIYAQSSDAKVTVYMEHPPFPDLSGSSALTPPPVDTVALKADRKDFSFLDVNGNIFSLMGTAGTEPRFVGSVVVHNGTLAMRLLYPADTYDVSRHLTQQEPNPQCLGDSMGETESHITGDNGILRISGKNVSNCLTTNIALNRKSQHVAYAVLTFKANGSATSLAPNQKLDSGKPLLDKEVRDFANPLILYTCLKPEGAAACTNTSQLFRLGKTNEAYSVDAVGDFDGVEQLMATFEVRSSQIQSYAMEATDIIVRTYAAGSTVTAFTGIPASLKREIRLDADSPLTLSTPLPRSLYSTRIDFSRDAALIARDEECRGKGTLQEMKEDKNGLLSYIVGCRNHTDKTIPFSSSNFYLWQAQYQHLSGALPAIILMDKFNTYFYKKLTPPGINANNYFSLPLQKPESATWGHAFLPDLLDTTPAYRTNGFLTPAPDLRDNNNKEFIIQHYTQNEGMINLESLSLTDLPAHWQSMAIQPKNYRTLKPDGQSEVMAYWHILPSLWRATVDSTGGQSLFLFNEQYDRQWVIVKAKTVLHAKCGGTSNCYLLDLPQGQSQFYLLYLPELFSAAGWVLTLGALIGGLAFFVRKNRTPPAA